MSIISSASGSVLISSGALNSNYSGSVAYGPKQVSDGLVLYVDAANPLSYPGSGTVWNDLTKNKYSGSLSGSVAVVPSWDSTHQGRIHIKATSSYIVGQNFPTVNSAFSSSFISFGNILDNVFVGTGSAAALPGAGGGTVAAGTSPKYTINLWFEIDYSKQAVWSGFSTPKNWYPFYGGNFPTLVAKYGDNNIQNPATGLLDENRQFSLNMLTTQINFTASNGTPLPHPVTNPYTLYFYSFEQPMTTGGGQRGYALRNTSSVYYIPDKKPVNVCIVFDSSKSYFTGDATGTDNRVKIYIDGFRTTIGDLGSTVGGVPTRNYLGSNAALSLGAFIGRFPRILEGTNHTLGYGAAFQTDVHFYMFQVYNKALSAKEVEQNYYAHKYRFIY